MQLTLVSGDAVFSLPLPDKVGGRYWVSRLDDQGYGVDLISVEGGSDGWILKSNKRVWVVDGDGRRLREQPVGEGEYHEIVVGATSERLLLHCEPSTDDRRTYLKYMAPGQGSVVIGRSEACDIRFESGFVSSRHAELVFDAQGASVHDLQSANGTFVNARRISSSRLSPGDVISLFGMNIVVARGLIAVNDPDGRVSIESRVLRPLPRQSVRAVEDDAEVEESSPTATFYRSPRFKRDVVTAAFTVDPPPQLNDPEELPIIMVLGPALTMGIASLFMGIFAIANVLGGRSTLTQALPSLVISLSMMVGMILWPILTRRYERDRRTAREKKRQTKYRSYIDSMRQTIEAERRSQSEILHVSIATLDDCANLIRTRARSLWERTASHNDFLKFRLGLGAGEFDAEIKHAPRKFTLEDDDLQDLMLALAEAPKTLPNVPVALSLLEHPVVGIIGDRGLTHPLLRGIVTQLVALHSYDELKLVVVYDPTQRAEWEYLRWFPHTWTDDRSIRFVAGTHEDLGRLGSVLEPELAAREALGDEADPVDATPHYLILALDVELAVKNEFVARLLKARSAPGFSLIALCDELHQLPRECRAVVEVGSGMAKMYEKDDTSGAFHAFRPDIGLDGDPRELAVQLANTQLDTMQARFVLPAVMTFLELHGVGKVEHLNAQARWQESNPVLSLEAAVGVGRSGEPTMLDVHERRHGPHGLIAGMTGSGKSEFIMTYILSLAVSYAPDEVAFVLIDYKGGGMANAFADLPHTAGTITNLDGAAVNRSLVSIQSELKRRQALFNDAGAATGTSNIDIYKYQSLYREGAVAEPLPHLLIISDEFAELKAQQPEFMTQLISAARIGRSLGVHLILATQKPSGVVDDQIWSNSRFRICLKVQEKADSMEVIKRPDAAALTATGRFYIQVGFDEMFDEGQSAWAGAPYYPTDRVEKPYDAGVSLIDDIGRPVRESRIDRRRQLVKHPPKQVDEVTRYLIQVARDEGRLARPLWLDPIPALIYADELRIKYQHVPVMLDPVIGEFDDPAHQRQALLTVPLGRDGNAVVYGAAGSGKTRFVTTMVSSLLEELDPSQVSVYILDFEAETLRAFKDAPHVGDVLCSYDAEKVQNLFGLLSGEIARRRQLFSDYGDIDTYREQAGESLESIVVVIHNYSAFVEAYDDKEEQLVNLTREGTRYGIHFVLTTASTTAVRFRVLQNFRQLFALQLNDPTEYTSLLGNLGGVLPSPLEGRGVFKSNAAYEFQTAHPSRSTANDLSAIRMRCKALSEAWSGPRARRIPILPDKVTPDVVTDGLPIGLESVPVGIDARSLEVVACDLRSRFLTVVLAQDADATPFLTGMALVAAREPEARIVVLDPDGVVGELAPHCEHVTGGEQVNMAALALFEEMVRRNNETKDAIESGRAAPTYEQVVYVVPDLPALFDALTPEAHERLVATIERCDASLGASFVVAGAEPALASMLQQSWARPHFGGRDGIWVGDGFASQFTLQTAKSADTPYAEIGPDFGYVLTAGKLRLIKLLNGRDGGEE